MSKRRESHCLLSRDLTCADSCFDSWINSPASTIKRAVFLFSSSTLRRNKADSSSCCDLADNPRAVEQHRLASDANHQIAQETDAQRHDGGGMCKRLLAGCGKSLNRDDSPPQGLKPSLILPDLRGAKAPLYHSAAGFRDFFRSLLGYCPKSGREPGAPKPGEAMAPTPISPIPSLQYSRPPFVYTNGWTSRRPSF